MADNVGRSIDNLNITIGQLKALLESKVGPATPIGGGAPSGSVDKLAEVLEKFTKDFKEEMNDQIKHLRRVMKAKSGVEGSRASAPKAPESSAAKASEDLEDYEDDLDNNYKFQAALEKSLQQNKLKYQREYITLAASNIKQQYAELRGLDNQALLAKIQGDTKYQRVLADQTMILKQNLSAARQLREQFSEMGNILGGFEQKLGLKTVETMFGGVVEQEMKFTQEIRQAAYETAGATKEARGLQRAFEDIGKTVAETGVNRTEFQKSYTKALRSGVKDLKQATNLTTTQLNTEKQLGMEAGSLQDTFQELALSGRMNAGQLAQMGRGMRDVAKATGLTGDALKGAIDSSKEFIDDLKKAGQLTASAASNVMEIQANAKKLGISSEMNPLMKAMSSSSELLLNASDETRSLLLQAARQAGRVEDAMNGTLLKSKEAIADTAQGLRGVLKQFGIESREQFDALSDTAKRDIQLKMQTAYKMDANTALGTLESLEKSSQGLMGKLAGIDKQMQQNITTQEKAALEEQKRQLKTSSQLAVLTALDEAAKGATDMGQALSKFGERKKDFEKDMQALGTSWSSETQVARDAIKGSLDNINEGLRKAGKEELKISSDEIEKAIKDPTALRELTAKITKGEQQLATAQKAQLDPVTETNQKLTEINDTLRNMSQNVISKIFNSVLGKIIVIGAVLAALAATAIKLGMTGAETVSTLKKLYKGGQDYYGGKQESLLTNIKNYLGVGAKKNAPVKPGTPGTPPVPGTPGTPGVPKSPVEAAAAAIAGETADKAGKAAAKAGTDVTKGGKYEKVFGDMLAALELTMESIDAIRQCVCKAGKKAAATPAGEAAAKAGTDVTKGGKYEKVFGDMLAALELTMESIDAIRQCVCKARKKAAGPAAAEGDAANKAMQEQQKKNISTDAKLNTMQLKEQKKEIRRGKKDDQLQKMEMKAAKDATTSTKSAECPPAPEPGCLEPDKLSKMGAEMKKAAPAVLMLAAGALLLGTALMWLGSKMLSVLGLDAAKLQDTATALVVIVGVAGAIAAAAYAALEVLASDEMKEFVNKAEGQKENMLKAAKALLIIGPGLLLLGAALTGFAMLVVRALGVDIGVAVEIGEGIVAIAAVAGGIAMGVAEFVEAYEKLDGNPVWQEITKNTTKIIGKIAKGAIAIMLLAPAILLLAVGIVKFADVVMGAAGLSPSKAAEVGFTVAALLLATAFIAGALIGAVYALSALGTLADAILMSGGTLLIQAAAGALALVLLTPVIMGLAIAVLSFCRLAVYLTGLDAGTAATTAWNVGVLLLSASLIAGAVLAATAALAVLSVFAVVGLAALIPIALGAAAMVILMPAIMALTAAVITAARLFTYIIDPKKSQEVAEGFANVLQAGADIAWSVVKMAGALTILSTFAVLGLVLIPSLILGAVALALLTPAIVLFTAAVVGIANAMMKVIDPKKAAQTAENLSKVLGAGADIAWQVVKMSGYATLLAGMATFAIPLVVAMFIGAGVLSLIGGAVAGFVGAIFEIAKKINKFGDPKKVAKISENVAAVLKASGDVADNMMAVKDKVGKIASSIGIWDILFGIGTPITQGTKVLQIIQNPIIGFVQAMIDFHSALTQVVSAKKATAIGKQVADILKAVGDVAENMQRVKEKVSAMGDTTLGAIYKTLFGSGPTMDSGTAALVKLQDPIIRFVVAIKNFYAALTKEITPANALSAGRGVAQILKACGDVAANMQKAKEGISALADTTLGAVWKFMFGAGPSIDDGTAALVKMEDPIVGFVKEIKIFGDKLQAVTSPEEIKKYSAIITNTGFLVGKVVRLIDYMTKQLVPLTTAGWISDSPIAALGKATQEFGGWFAHIARLLQIGIINPIMMYFPDQKMLENVKIRLDGIVKVMQAIPPMLDTLGSLVNRYAVGGWFTASPIEQLAGLTSTFSTWFASLGYMLRSGIINPVLSYFPSQDEVTEVVTRLEGMVVVLQKLQGVLDELGIVMAALSAISMPFGFMSLFPMAGLGSMLIGLGGAASAMKGIGSLFGGGGSVGTPSDNAIDQRVQQQTAEATQRQMMLMQTLVNEAVYGKGISVHSDNQNLAVAKTAASTAGASAADIQSKVAAHKAGSEIPASKVMSDELTDIASETGTQTDLQRKLVSLFEDVVKALGPKAEPVASQAPAGEVNTAGDKVSGKPSSYYRSSSGMVNNGPSRQAYNMGPPKRS